MLMVWLLVQPGVLGEDGTYYEVDGSGYGGGELTVCSTQTSSSICSCYALDGRELRVDCSKRRLTEVPPSIPSNTVTL